MDSKTIVYPYIPEGRTIEYVPASNFYMRVAMEFTRLQSLDKVHPTGSVIVKANELTGNEIIGFGANGTDYHEKNGCERKKLQIPTGMGYELCEGCHPKTHSESRAIEDAIRQGESTAGSDLYLWGHWWCCKWCWDEILEAKIRQVYLLENSEVLFDREREGNIIGRQFKN
jgi:deoxycytidylate deaminase